MLIERNTDLYNETTDTCTAEERQIHTRSCNEVHALLIDIKTNFKPKYTIIDLISLSN